MAQEGRRGNSGNTRSISDMNQNQIRGRAAQDLLDNKTLGQALDDMRKAAHEKIEQSKYDEREKREDLYSFLQAIKKLEEQLAIYVKQGKDAGARLEVIHNGGERKRRT